MKSLLVALTLVCCAFAGTAPAGEANPDQGALLQMEQEWLDAYRSGDADALERILAPDFVHILADGRIVARKDELAYFRGQTAANAGKRPPQHFEHMQVRIYGDIGVVNGRTVVTGSNGNSARETSFTDVFRKANGRWQAVNAQETTMNPKYAR